MFILWLVCFGCYVLFTRQPDYFYSERSRATIVKTGKQAVAQFSYGNKIHHAAVPYPFLYTPDEKVAVIFETADPVNAKVYAFTGYWLRFGELFVSLFIVAILYWVSVSVTKDPAPEALQDEKQAVQKKPRKPKYNS